MTFLAKKASYGPCIGTIRKHLIGSSLGARRLVEIAAGHVEAFLEAKSSELAAETLNHLRGYLGRAFKMARQVASLRRTESGPLPTGLKLCRRGLAIASAKRA